jgi:hypothetical protein
MNLLEILERKLGNNLLSGMDNKNKPLERKSIEKLPH